MRPAPAAPVLVVASGHTEHRNGDREDEYDGNQAARRHSDLLNRQVCVCIHCMYGEYATLCIAIVRVISANLDSSE